MRLNIFSGKEKTYQAWNGVAEYLLDSMRTYNPSGSEKNGDPYNNETDNYTQTHYQLFFNHLIGKRISFNTALFLTKGKGCSIFDFHIIQILYKNPKYNIFKTTTDQILNSSFSHLLQIKRAEKQLM